MNAHDQIHHFVADSLKAAQPVADDSGVFMNRTLTYQDRQSTTEANERIHLQEKLDDTKQRIRDLRTLVMQNGVSDEFLADFDRVAGLQTALEADAAAETSEAEKTWTDKFFSIVDPLHLSRRALASLRKSA